MKENNYSVKLNLSEKIAKIVAKGAGFSFIGMSACWVIEYLIRIMIARQLGVSGYGIINLGIAIMTVVGTISLCGLDGGITRFVSYYLGKRRLDKIKSSIISGAQIIISVSILSGVFLFIFADKIALDLFKEPQLILVLKIFAISIPFFCLLSFFISIFRGFKKINYMVYIQAGFNLSVRLLFLIFFIILGFKLLGISLIYFISLVIASIVSIFLFKRITKEHREWKEAKSSDARKDLIFFSSPLMISQILGRLRGKTDTILIGYFITVSQVGLYSVALPVARMLQFGLNSLNSIFMPSISELYGKGNLEELNNTYKRVAKWAFCITLPMFLVFFCYPKYILATLFGVEYQKAWLPLMILSVGIFINVSSGSFGETLIAIGKTKINMLLITIFVFINVVLDIILIPRVGLIGAAIANSFSLILVCVIGLLYLNKYLKLQPFSLAHIKILLSTSVSLTSLYFINKLLFRQFTVWLFLIFIMILYLLSFYGLFLLNGFDSIEINIMKNIYRKIKFK